MAAGRARKGPGILIPLSPVIVHPIDTGTLQMKVCVLPQSKETVPSGVSVPSRYIGDIINEQFKCH